MTIPQILLTHLERLEPNATFTGSPPKIQSSSGKRYFAKIGSSMSDIDQYTGEAMSLKAMEKAAPGLSPRVLAFGCIHSAPLNELEPSSSSSTDVQRSIGQMYFLSEYRDIAPLTPEAADVLAKRLATELHRYKSTIGFGFDIPTYCGATRQENGWYKSWADCYGDLLGGLLGKLEDSKFEELYRKGEEVRER